MDKCKELTWPGFLSEGLPIAHSKHRTHKAAIGEVAKDWRAWKKSVTYARLEKKCRGKKAGKDTKRSLKKTLESVCPYA